jgi:hypothetical protein
MTLPWLIAAEIAPFGVLGVAATAIELFVQSYPSSLN